jgi:hypothetical protein
MSQPPPPPEPRVFEGAEITEFVARIPAVTVDCDDYPRGTILRLACEVQVGEVAFPPNKDGATVARVHKMTWQDVSVVAAFAPGQDASTVGGSASSHPVPDEAGTAELGVAIARTSDTWPAGVAALNPKEPANA